MTPEDLIWVRGLLAEHRLDGPVLELGVGYEGSTSRSLIEMEGLKYFGTDLEKTPAVDFVANFENSKEMEVFAPAAPFGTVLVLNVLEHTFDPVRVLDNAIALLRPGGKCAVIVPSVWTLHNYPMDAWRMLPNFFEEYARRRGLALDRSHFDFVGYGPVEQYRDAGGNYRFPPPCPSAVRLKWSRIVHKIFNTVGRGMFFPTHVAVGVLLTKPEA